ncbi:hypothetical protein [Niveispirillum irakense]|uniref:hypothetical protein n=1 Tax=Niveispirillum irakense TaxID=34011 RepID=UPI0003F53E76|nr:hypothetical protein [Niveispirillum irakense]
MSIFANLFQPGAIGSNLGIPPFKPLEMMTPGGLAQMAAKALPGPAGQLLSAGANLAQTLGAGAQAPAGALTGAMANAAGAAASGLIPGAGALPGTLANAAASLAGEGAPGAGMVSSLAQGLPENLSQSAFSQGLSQAGNALAGDAAAKPLRDAAQLASAAQNMLPAVSGALPGGTNPSAAGAIAQQVLAGQMPKADSLIAAMPATGSQPVDKAVTVAKALKQPL